LPADLALNQRRSLNQPRDPLGSLDNVFASDLAALD
jgi:hypothetical protein